MFLILQTFLCSVSIFDNNQDLEKYLGNVKKNQRHERRDWRAYEKEYKGQIEQLNMENERLQLQLRVRTLRLRDVRVHTTIISVPLELGQK